MKFLNPYTFVPFAPVPTGDLKPGTVAGHGRDVPGTLRGQLRVVLECVTPLVLFDQASLRAVPGAPDRHRSFACPTADGLPLLSATELRGALRAQFTALTGSRWTAFEETRRLTVRKQHDRRDVFEPVRVSAADDGSLRIQRLGSEPRATACLPFTTAPNGPWLSSAARPAGEDPLTIDDHGAEIVAVVEACFWQRGRQSRSLDRVVAFTRVLAADGQARFAAATTRARNAADGIILTPNAGPGATPMWGNTEALGQREIVRGRLRVSGRTAPRNSKHDEVVFVLERCALNAELSGRDAVAAEPLAQDVEALWDQIARDHARGREADPGQVRGQWATSGRTLAEQQLVWALFEGETVREIVPTAYAPRRTLDHPPVKGIPESVLPLTLASERAPLSAADRVFGYVSQRRGSRGSAYRSHVRLSPPRCTAQPEDGWRQAWGDDGLPLGILASPKPAFERFYGPFERPDQGNRRLLRLAGMKRYWQRQGGAPETGATPVEGQHLVPAPAQFGNGLIVAGSEAIAGARLPTNRSVRDWVRAGSGFEVDLAFENLRPGELGALLWVLGQRDAPSGATARLALGGAVPLGYGNVAVSVDLERSRIVRAADHARRYLSPESDLPPAGPEIVTECLGALHDAFGGAESFSAAPQVRALLAVESASFASAAGLLPVFSPRPFAARAHANNHGYLWFPNAPAASVDAIADRAAGGPAGPAAPAANPFAALADLRFGDSPANEGDDATVPTVAVPTLLETHDA